MAPRSPTEQLWISRLYISTFPLTDCWCCYLDWQWVCTLRYPSAINLCLCYLQLGFRFPLPAKHLAITDYKWVLSWMMSRLQSVVLVTAVWCRGTVNSKSKDWKIKMRPVIAPLLLFRMLDGAVCRNCNNFTNGDTRTSTFLSVYSG